MQTNYQAGQWYVLVAPGALIALSPDASTELVTRIWERQQDSIDLAAVIDTLTDDAAGSFAAMQPFAAVVLEGPDARIAVRGDVTVEVTGPQGAESFTGANVTTWSERFVESAARISVSVNGSESGVDLPIIGGIVRAARASAEIEPADVEISDAAPAVASIEEAVVAEPIAEEPVEEPAAEPAEGPLEEPVVEEEPAVEEAPAPAEPAPETAPQPIDDAVDGATLVPTEQAHTSDIDEFEQLFGQTVASRPASAPPAPPAPPALPAPGAGDHDGATISSAQARALRQTEPAVDPDAPTAVLPVVPSAQGRVRVSTGQQVTLDRTVIIGRKPRSTRASGADLPHLVAVESPQQDISRSHLEIRPEGDTVVVVDLHTTNGSTLLRPGVDPLRLHPGEQTLVLSGDVVDLGDGVTVTFEDLP
ncbi:FHA domain-containing protein [Microbacterium sp. A82]|uniref:FHA domain-containing protein n=1 Tax=Microbacterium sp. A82 TaxID=3450452 RepID=UPI003F2DB78B